MAALPNNWIPAVEWGGPALSAAMTKHHKHYDHPAHYLRISGLFDGPFWRNAVNGSYFMIDAFGGTCVYDESARHAAGTYGVLGWLLAGEPAATMSNFNDEELIAAVLDRFPRCLGDARSHFLEGRVHRWVGAVNGLPGGLPMQPPESRHRPEPVGHPGLFVVGDYLFDSTLNGVLDSAELAVDKITDDIQAKLGLPPTPVRCSAAASWSRCHGGSDCLSPGGARNHRLMLATGAVLDLRHSGRASPGYVSDVPPRWGRQSDALAGFSGSARKASSPPWANGDADDLRGSRGGHRGKIVVPKHARPVCDLRRCLNVRVHSLPTDGIVAVRRIRFASHSVTSGRVCRTFKHPRLCLAVDEPAKVGDLPKKPAPSAPGDELFVVFVQPKAVAEWEEIVPPVRAFPASSDPDTAEPRT